MYKKKRKKRKTKLFKIILFIIIIILVFEIFNKSETEKILKKTEKEEVNITEYYIYGNHLNIKGNLKYNDKIDKINLVLKNNDDEIKVNLKYTLKNNKIKFTLSDEIHNGLYLDNIKLGKYILLLKIKSNNNIKYYTLNNKTKYNSLSYYTITKDNSNNKIKINTYEEIKNHIKLNVTPANKKDKYYDVIIDPGHGGIDVGASAFNHNEAEISLDYALSLKNELEKIGLKVKLTRNKDEYLYNYGKESRISTIHESKAKYSFSIHLNSSDLILKSGGIEVYAPNNTNLDFASSIADNVVKYAKTTYSSNLSNKINDGVYVKTFSVQNVKNSNEEAISKGYKPYKVDTNTTYYYMLRETGGIATNAYIDGRNKKTGENIYYDSNIGTESYLIELGYINFKSNLNNILYNKDNYIKGIVESIKKELDI